MSFSCSLANAKISASVIVNEKQKASVSDQTFAIGSKDLLVKDILASDEDRLRGVSPRKADLIHGKWFQPYETISAVDHFWWKKNTWHCNSWSHYNIHHGL